MTRIAKVGGAEKSVVRRRSRPADAYVISHVELMACNPNGFLLGWGAKGVGFGQLYVYATVSGELRCMNEYMSRKFCTAVLGFFAQELTKRAVVVGEECIEGVELSRSECFGEWDEEGIRGKSGQLALRVRTVSNGIHVDKKLYVELNAETKKGVLLGSPSPRLVLGAFERLAQEMQLDDVKEPA